ncbi:ABC transporter permease [Anabaena minutissima FACHB-250]|nr:ABC transporter permease [Anabaena minutissima FACHB-250]
MRRIWAQCLKELVQLRRDRLIMALAFLLPLSTFLIYSFTVRLETKHIPLAIQDFELTSISRAYIERIFATNQFQPVLWSSYDQLQDIIDRGTARAKLIIPPDFSRRIKSDKTSNVQILVDGTDVNNARIIKNNIEATTSFFAQSIGLNATPIQLVAQKRILFNPGRKESLYVVPGAFAVVLWLYPALLATISMSREKEQGTILQVYASGINAAEFLLGKSLAYFFIAITETLIIMSLAALLFHLKFVGNWIPFITSTPIFLMTSIIFGFFIGVRSSNQSEAVQKVGAASILSSLLLSGFIYPLSNVPFPLSLITYIIPVRYYIEITRDAFVRGTGWTVVWPSLLILAIIYLILFIFTCRNLRNMQLSNS